MSDDQHYALCSVRQKLMLFGHLAGTVETTPDRQMVVIQRIQLGELFTDLARQMDEVLAELIRLPVQ